MHSRTVHLQSWFFEPVSKRSTKRGPRNDGEASNRTWSGSVRIWGRVQNHGTNWFRSSSILRPVSPKTFLTHRGTLISISGPMYMPYARRFNLSDQLLHSFRSGFPHDWFAQLCREPHPFYSTSPHIWDYALSRPDTLIKPPDSDESTIPSLSTGNSLDTDFSLNVESLDSIKGFAPSTLSNAFSQIFSGGNSLSKIDCLKSDLIRSNQNNMTEPPSILDKCVNSPDVYEHPERSPQSWSDIDEPMMDESQGKSLPAPSLKHCSTDVHPQEIVQVKNTPNQRTNRHSLQPPSFKTRRSVRAASFTTSLKCKSARSDESVKKATRKKSVRSSNSSNLTPSGLPAQTTKGLNLETCQHEINRGPIHPSSCKSLDDGCDAPSGIGANNPVKCQRKERSCTLIESATEAHYPGACFSPSVSIHSVPEAMCASEVRGDRKCHEPKDLQTVINASSDRKLRLRGSSQLNGAFSPLKVITKTHHVVKPRKGLQAPKVSGQRCGSLGNKPQYSMQTRSKRSGMVTCKTVS